MVTLDCSSSVWGTYWWLLDLPLPSQGNTPQLLRMSGCPFPFTMKWSNTIVLPSMIWYSKCLRSRHLLWQSNCCFSFKSVLFGCPAYTYWYLSSLLESAVSDIVQVVHLTAVKWIWRNWTPNPSPPLQVIDYSVTLGTLERTCSFLCQDIPKASSLVLNQSHHPHRDLSKPGYWCAQIQKHCWTVSGQYWACAVWVVLPLLSFWVLYLW